MMKFTEAQLENAIIQLLEQEGIPHLTGDQISRASMDEVLIREDLRNYLRKRYKEEGITPDEVNRIILELVQRYNERKETDTLRSEVLDDFTDEIIDLYHAMKKERESFHDMGIDDIILQ